MSYLIDIIDFMKKKGNFMNLSKNLVNLSKFMGIIYNLTHAAREVKA